MSTAPVAITFTWWGNPARAETTQKVIDKFHAKYPFITVEGSPTTSRPTSPSWPPRPPPAMVREAVTSLLAPADQESASFVDRISQIDSPATAPAPAQWVQEMKASMAAGAQ